MGTLVALSFLPLAIILMQWALGAEGMIANAPYKLAFVVPPLIYCRARKVGIFADILKPANWRNDLWLCIVLGLLAIVVFWGVYIAWGNVLLDKDEIVGKIQQQFSVNAVTVFLIAPFTILANSMLEEFFYRGFAFGLLVRQNAVLGYLFPAAVFTVQHVLFFLRWGMGAIPFALATLGLLVFALVLQKIYSHADTLIAPWVIHIFGDVAMMSIAAEMLLIK